jgi:hypothetical protein
MDITAIGEVFANLTTGRHRAAAPGTISAGMSTGASPTGKGHRKELRSSGK